MIEIKFDSVCVQLSIHLCLGDLALSDLARFAWADSNPEMVLKRWAMLGGTAPA